MAVFQNEKIPTVQEQRLTLRKPRYRDGGPSWWFRWLFLSPEDWVRRLLLRLGTGARAVTFGWFLVALAGDGVTCIGTPWAFLIGALLVQAKIILDIVDGELGRYQKQFLSDEQNLKSHIKGIYLDRIQHAIESPLWGLALGFGAYRLTGSVWMIVCGICLAVYRSFNRYEPLLREHILNLFRSRLAVLEGHLKAQSPLSAKSRSWVAVQLQRICGTARLWTKNGKRFNLLVILCAGADIVLHWQRELVLFIPCLIGVAAVIAVIDMTIRFASIQFGDALLSDCVRAAESPIPDDQASNPSPRS